MRRNTDFKFIRNDLDIAYLLGIFITKGSPHFKRKTFIVRSIDREVCERVQVACKLLFNKDYAIKQSGNYYSIEVGHRSLLAWLVGVTENKNSVPNLIYKQSRDWQNEFMAGILDGAGWVSVSEERQDKERNLSWWVSIGISGPAEKYIKDIARFLQRISVPFRFKADDTIRSPNASLIFDPEHFINSGFYFYSLRKQARLNEL